MQVTGPRVVTCLTMLAMRPSVPVLASLRLFQGIDEADLAAMAATMRSRRHRAGEVICHQGDPGDVLYVIEGGSVKLVLPSPRGDEAILAILRRQGFSASWPSWMVASSLRRPLRSSRPRR